tara:strand:- start:8967 stop:9464 length:498 start_codon:yes stop_codon:yes gene_type:complete
VDKLYEYIKSIYIGGLSIVIDNTTKSNSVLISNITDKHIKLMHKYMLSIGIETYFHMYSSEQMDLLFRDFLYEVGKIENLGLEVIMDWKKQHIKKIAMELNRLTPDSTKQFLKTLQNYNKVNIFFGFYKPLRLKDFGFKVKDKDTMYLVYFDFADRGKYETKYKI